MLQNFIIKIERIDVSTHKFNMELLCDLFVVSYDISGNLIMNACVISVTFNLEQCGEHSSNY